MDMQSAAAAPAPQSSTSSGGGIYNMGNTCYLNSTLQALAHCHCFRDFVMSNDHDPSCSITNALKSLFQQISESKTACRPTELFRHLESKIDIMDLRQQNDALEFLTILIDKINSEVGRPRIRVQNPFNNRVKSHEELVELANIDWVNANASHYHRHFTSMFYGQNVVQVKCMHCGGNEHRGENFASIGVSFPSDTQQVMNVAQMISNAYGCELLHRSKCDICGAKDVPCTKSLRVWRTPQILPVHLKRFDAKGNKITKPIEIPHLVSLNNICISEAPAHYRLKAAVCHVGWTQGGHYYTYCLDDKSKTWSLIDDEAVYRDVDPSRIDTANVYALFYERVIT